jgi:hypothetical protein
VLIINQLYQPSKSPACPLHPEKNEANNSQKGEQQRGIDKKFPGQNRLNIQAVGGACRS